MKTFILSIIYIILCICLLSAMTIKSETYNNEDIYYSYKDKDIDKYITSKKLFVLCDTDVKDTLFIQIQAQIDTTNFNRTKNTSILIIKFVGGKRVLTEAYIFSDNGINHTGNKYHKVCLKAKSQIEILLKDINFRQLYNERKLNFDSGANSYYLSIVYILIPNIVLNVFADSSSKCEIKTKY